MYSVLCCRFVGVLVCAAKATVWPLWWLPIVFIVIVLIVIVIIMYVTCSLYRNRGEDYEGNIRPVVLLLTHVSHKTAMKHRPMQWS